MISHCIFIHTNNEHQDCGATPLQSLLQTVQYNFDWE